MRAVRVILLTLALFVAFGATPAAAARTPVVRFSGASPTLTFTPPGCRLGVETCGYVFTNQGQGTVFGRPLLTWKYDERGTVFPNFTQTVEAASYTFALIEGRNDGPGRPVTLHVIPSTYKVTYDNPATAPCSSGTFSAKTREGVTVKGTFDCLGGLPSAYMEFTLELEGRPETVILRPKAEESAPARERILRSAQDDKGFLGGRMGRLLDDD